MYFKMFPQNIKTADSSTHSFEIRHFLTCPHCDKDNEVVVGKYQGLCMPCRKPFEYNIDNIDNDKDSNLW